MTDNELLHAAAHRGQQRDPRLLYREAADAASTASPYTTPIMPARSRGRAPVLVAIGGAIAACALAAVLLVGGTNQPTSRQLDTVPTVPTASIPVPTQLGATTSTTASAFTYVCGNSFPLAFDTLGFTGPTPGPATDSTTPPETGQLVEHWTRDDQSFELRWPPNALRSATPSLRPSAGFSSGNGLAGLGFVGSCANFSIRAFSASSADAQTLSEQLNNSTSDAIRAWTKSTVPLVRERRTVSELPGVGSCKGAQGAVVRAATTRPVSGQGPTASPDDALRQFLDTDPSAQTFADVGYIDFTIPDGSHYYGYTVGNEEIPVLIAVKSNGTGWFVTSYTSSGC